MHPHEDEPESSQRVSQAVQVIATRQHLDAAAARARLLAEARRWHVSPTDIARGVLLFHDN